MPVPWPLGRRRPRRRNGGGAFGRTPPIRWSGCRRAAEAFVAKGAWVSHLGRDKAAFAPLLPLTTEVTSGQLGGNE
jgi:hypothetical protein